MACTGRPDRRTPPCGCDGAAVCYYGALWQLACPFCQRGQAGTYEGSCWTAQLVWAPSGGRCPAVCARRQMSRSAKRQVQAAMNLNVMGLVPQCAEMAAHACGHAWESMGLQARQPARLPMRTTLDSMVMFRKVQCESHVAHCMVSAGRAHSWKDYTAKEGAMRVGAWSLAWKKLQV